MNSGFATADTGLAPGDGRSAAVFVVEGNVERETAAWLEILALLRLEAGWSVVTIDCTATAGLSGHLLGVLRRVARVAARRDATVGVVTTGAAEVVRAHAGDLVTAPTLERLLSAVGAVRTADPIKLTGPRAGPTLGA